MKYLMLFAVAALLLSACAPKQKPVACTADARLCPDGTAVGRVPPNCDFAPCPEANASTANATNETNSSDYIRYPVDHAAARGEFCAANYDPVCGWWNSSIKCLAYPCAQTYSNSCWAANDEKVDYYTLGACPKAGGGVQDSTPPSNSTGNACAGRRPELCVETYSPVCGYSNTAAKTYSNDCFACADTTIVYWTQGVCPAVNRSTSGLPTIQAVIHCTYPQPKCTNETNPVCGLYELNTGDSMKQTFNNSCLACSTMKVTSYTQGAC